LFEIPEIVFTASLDQCGGYCSTSSKAKLPSMYRSAVRCGASQAMLALKAMFTGNAGCEGAGRIFLTATNWLNIRAPWHWFALVHSAGVVLFVYYVGVDKIVDISAELSPFFLPA